MEPREVLRDFIWKIPLTGLLVALHFFFESTFWSWVLCETNLHFGTPCWTKKSPVAGRWRKACASLS
jgi:hypothetical protein